MGLSLVGRGAGLGERRNFVMYKGLLHFPKALYSRGQDWEEVQK